MIRIKFIGQNTRYIGEAASYDDAYKIMAKFIRNAERSNNFQWYYTRVIPNEEELRIRFDVGSHTEFFDFEFNNAKDFDIVCQQIGF